MIMTHFKNEVNTNETAKKKKPSNYDQLLMCIYIVPTYLIAKE